MKINFVLPGLPWRPVGGFRVVYEYANNLVARGHEVCVIHPAFMKNVKTRLVLYSKMLKNIGYWYNILFSPEIRWQKVDRRVKILYVREPNSRVIPAADIVFATAWQTSEYVMDYPQSKGRKFYLVMDFDPWLAPKGKLKFTWNLPFRKIVISKWLKEKVIQYGGDNVVWISLGIAHERFRLIKDINKRPKTISMMYSIFSYKSSKDGIKALEICKSKHPDLKAVIFAPRLNRPEDIPDWINYSGGVPDEKVVDIYNNSSIFVSSSLKEGFCFPAAEAMACGCAVAITDSGGIRDYAIAGVNSLISRPGDSQALAENVLRLLEYDDFRICIAENGYKHIQSFTWKRSTDLLENEINRIT